ncbi:MAG: acyl carrier protein [Rhizobiaceae bacterium]
MSKDIEDGILALFAQYADKNKGPIAFDTQLEKLGIHSLELTEIVMEIEDKYDVEIDLSTVDTWQSFSSVGDIISAVKALLAQKA